eukprot:TRINITY_DN1983_c0_g1_i5.p1 TRINITY_DN1983_c0_g1~~TRINITY_DN1983_c0_g1_i5.p1  ORF type:complete len:1215 (-),score=232.86 TRINITY_DN1983_c0_g1_i5:94-3738(-)
MEQTATLSITCSEIYYQSSGSGIEGLQLLNNYKFTNLKIKYRACKLGEIIVETSTSKVCKQCEFGYYSIDQKSNICQKCPENAECTGGDSIVVKQGYWRPTNDSAFILVCSNKLESCTSSEQTTNDQSNITRRMLADDQSANTRQETGNALCAKGYIGFRCEACDEFNEFWGDHYFLQAEGKCTVCAYDFSKVATLIVTVLASFLSMAMSIGTNVEKSDADKMHGALMKMLLHHVQILVVIQSIGMTQKSMQIKDEMNTNLNAPISAVKTVGSQIEATSSSLDCFLIKQVSKDHFPFIKIAVSLCMPVIMFILFMVFYIIKTKAAIASDKKKKAAAEKQLELAQEKLKEQQKYKKLNIRLPKKVKKEKSKQIQIENENGQKLNSQDTEHIDTERIKTANEENDDELKQLFEMQTQAVKELLEKRNQKQRLNIEHAALGVSIFKNNTKELKFEVMTKEQQRKQLKLNLKQKVVSLKEFLVQPAPVISWNIIYPTVVFIVILSQPTLVKQLLGMSFCKSIILEETNTTLKFIHSSPSHECYTSVHIVYLLSMILPAIILWAIIIPSIIYMLLSKYKSNMDSKENIFKFGLMVEEYKKERFYWELVKMGLKMGLSGIIILFEMNIGQKGIFIGMALTAYLLASHFLQPFRNQFFNKIDTRSTLIGFFSTQLALIAYNDEIYQALIYYLILLFMNFGFFGYLIYYIGKNKVNKIKEVLAKIKEIIHKLKNPQQDENLSENSEETAKESEHHQDAKEEAAVVNKNKQKKYNEKILHLLQVLNAYAQQNKNSIIGQEFVESVSQMSKELKLNQTKKQIKKQPIKVFQKASEELAKQEDSESSQEIQNIFTTNFRQLQGNYEENNSQDSFDIDLPLINMKLNQSLGLDQSQEENYDESQQNENKQLQMIELKCDNLSDNEEMELQLIKKQQEKLNYNQTLMPFNSNFLFAYSEIFEINMKIVQLFDKETSVEIEIQFIDNSNLNKGYFEDFCTMFDPQSSKFFKSVTVNQQKDDSSKYSIIIALKDYKFEIYETKFQFILDPKQINNNKKVFELVIPLFIHQFCKYEKYSLLEIDIKDLLQLIKKDNYWSNTRLIQLNTAFLSILQQALTEKFPNIELIQELSNKTIEYYHGSFSLQLKQNNFQFYFTIIVSFQDNSLKISSLPINLLRNKISNNLKEKKGQQEIQEKLEIENLEEENIEEESEVVLSYWLSGIKKLFSTE